MAGDEVGADPAGKGAGLSDLLREYQRNSLVATLRACEKSLREAQEQLRGPLTEGILYRRVLNLPAGRRQSALDLVEECLALLAEIARGFDLRPAEEDLAQAIAASMTVCWANLGDAKSGKLRAYGEVDPRLGEALDPSLDRLERLALAIASLLQVPGRE
ncbi:MAG: hypothetical protein HPY83_17310 [Anaerolineae bacterium]|nr:hypothetical protein [Anaerolineae bacterium]